jgi:hypothetical protein
MIPFLAIHAKGGESMSPKQKDRTTTNFKNLVFQRVFSIGILLCSKGGESSIFKKNDISKPSWTLRGGSHLGGVLFSQRKSIRNKGRKFQILFIYLWPFAKDLWKGFTKEFAKTKHVVQAWSKILKIKKQSMHILSVLILAQFQATFALTLCKLVQLCASIFALVYVGINHQKGGDWKGIRLTPSS